MEVESQYPQEQPNSSSKDVQMSKALRRTLLVLNFTMMAIGGAGTPLILRLYFIHGGNRIWLSSWLQAAGFPLILLPLSASYARRRRQDRIRGQPTKPYLMTLPIFLACAAIGVLTGLDNFFYAYGLSYLPLSTSSILISTQLGFTAFFALLIVKQRFTAYSVNAVVLLTVGAVILGLRASGDRPEGESQRQYYVGFFMTLAAAALYGVILPLLELTYANAGQTVTYTLVMEVQLVVGFFAAAFCLVGMLFNKDFQVIPREGREFNLGESTYYTLLVCSAIMWQFFFLGTVGAIFYGSALLAGVILEVLIPVTELLAVIFFHESFSGEKGVSLALSLWGFASYFYGEYNENKGKKVIVEADPNLLDSSK